MDFLSKIFSKTSNDNSDSYGQALLRHEAKIGGQLFGKIPKGHLRQFFCLDENTWVWHEEWIDNGQKKVMTTRYDVRPYGVIKSQDGKAHRKLSRNEASNLYRAVDQYADRVEAEYQRILQAPA